MYNILPGFAKREAIGLSKFINTLIDLLNEEAHLPKMLLVMPDKDILALLQDNDASNAVVIGMTLYYLVKQFDMFIERR